MSVFAMYGQMTAQLGQRDELVKLLLEASHVINNIESCKLYIVNESVEDVDVVWVTELWETEQAHKDSLKNEQLLAIIQQARPLISSVKPVRLNAVGGKGC